MKKTYLEVSRHLKPLRFAAQAPADKSLSHRSVLFASLAKGTSQISGFLMSADCLGTVRAMRSLGVRIDVDRRHARLKIQGRGLGSLKKPKSIIDCGNSGTTIRLLSGILAACPFTVTLTGDASLKQRPMARIRVPLERAGARIQTTGKRQTPPITVHGSAFPKPVRYHLPTPSAQVKSAILLAGLHARGQTVVSEDTRSRDHTERFLKRLGASVRVAGKRVYLTGGQELKPFRTRVPGDISSAAFLIAASLIVPGSCSVIRHVLSNPTRDGFIRVLKRMGAGIRVLKVRRDSMEETRDYEVRYSRLKAFQIKRKEIPSLIDELPILMVLATQAKGRSRIEGAEELRVKETDRIESMVKGLSSMGANIRASGGTVTILGPTALHGSVVNSFSDHRTAMSHLVAGLVAKGKTRVLDTGNIGTSFPEFEKRFRSFGISLKKGRV